MNKIQLLNVEEQIVILELGSIHLKGELVIPTDAEGIILFTQGSGSSRYSTFNHYLAHILRQQGRLATFLIDLLTKEEEAIDQRTQHFRCDIDFLAARLVDVTDWLSENPPTQNLKVGYFGVNRGSGAALLAATARPMVVKAIVSRSGQTDLVSAALPCVQAPTLLIVGENDYPIIAMNEDAIAQISAQHKQLHLIPGATHQFGEPGAIEEVGRLAGQWFKYYLTTLESSELHLSPMSWN
jgi:putative phosphoribosyl transferase